MDDFNAAEELYREEIMDHYNNPRNFGELKGADIRYSDYNPVCGDSVEIQLKMSNSQVEEAMFNGKGCAISQAAASMLTEYIRGKSLQQLLKVKSEDVLQLLKVNPGPVRIKCALLALRAAQKGIVIYEASLLKTRTAAANGEANKQNE